MREKLRLSLSNNLSLSLSRWFFYLHLSGISSSSKFVSWRVKESGERREGERERGREGEERRREEERELSVRGTQKNDLVQP